MEPLYWGRGNTRKQLHGRAVSDRGPIQEYFYNSKDEKTNSLFTNPQVLDCDLHNCPTGFPPFRTVHLSKTAYQGLL